MQLEDVLIRVNGKAITVADTLTYLKATGVFHDTICHLVETEAIKARAEAEKALPPEEVVHAFLESKRAHWGLVNAEQLHRFCRTNGVTHEQWLEISETECLWRHLLHRVVDPQAIAAHFTEHAEAMKTLAVSRIVVGEAALAERVAAEAKTEPARFGLLAREHSDEENTARAGGYLGIVKRGMLPESVEAELFQGAQGSVHGPYDEDGVYSIYHIDAIQGADLTPALREEIRGRLFRQWVRGALEACAFERPE